jgi:hypothetical protein
MSTIDTRIGHKTPADQAPHAPTASIPKSNVWDAMEYVRSTLVSALAAHLADTADAHAASAISFAPAGAVAATDVQAAIEEVATDAATALTAHTSDATAAHAASAIAFTPAGAIAATDVQGAIAELDAEKQQLDSDLTAISALSPSDDDIIQRKAGAWTNRTMAQLLTDLGAPPLSVPQGRLTLTSATPVTTTDVVGAVSVYYTTATGLYVPVYNGSRMTMVDFASELTLALDSNSGHTNYHQSGKNYDLFYAYVSGTHYFGTGPKWDDGAGAGSDKARGTGAASTELELYRGVWVNKNSMTLRHGSSSGNTVTVPAKQGTYLGSFRTVADGQVTDSVEKRLLFNAYNRSIRTLERGDPAGTWTYSTATLRQANANTDNKVEVLDGLGGMVVDLSLTIVYQPSASGGYARCQIGVDSITVSGSRFSVIQTSAGANQFVQSNARYVGSPGLGYTYLAWLEVYGAGTSITFYGQSAASPPWDNRSGLGGFCVC